MTSGGGEAAPELACSLNIWKTARISILQQAATQSFLFPANIPLKTNNKITSSYSAQSHSRMLK